MTVTDRSSEPHVTRTTSSSPRSSSIPRSSTSAGPRCLSARRRAGRGIAAECGVDILFAPSVDELYPDGYRTWVDVEAVGGEAEARPGHFRGVATVCLKLFNIVRPRRAYFGQKDAQQAQVVRRLVRDLNLELEVRVLPTVRDPDGLALSSRNVRLSPEIAPVRSRFRVRCRTRSARRIPSAPCEPSSTGSTPTTSRSSSSTVHRCSPPQSASAPSASSTTCS